MYLHYDKVYLKALKYERKRREFDAIPLTASAKERAMNYAVEDTRPMIPMLYVAFFADFVLINVFFTS